MKKGSILIMAVAIMASVASCNKSDDTQFTPESGIPVTLKFTASSSPETRIAYDGKEGKWKTGDKVYVVVTDTKGTEYTSKSCTVTPIDDGATATIDAEFTIGEGTEIKKLTAYHASDNMVVSYDGGNIDFSLPDTPDGTLSYLTTSAYTYDEGSEPTVEQGSDIELSATTLKFKHILARIDITTDIENVSSITLSFVGATVPTAGKLNIKNGTITPDNGKDKQPKLMTIKGGKNTYQIGFIPVKFASATTMKATVITDTEAYTKEVELTEIVAATLNTLDLTTSKMTEATVITGDNFQPIADDLDGNFVLTEDLTLKEIPHIKGFSGTLDGNGHSINISGSESSTTSGQGGIFANTTGNAKISNLDIIGGDRQATMAEGGMLVGLVSDGSTLTIDNVHVSGTITASRDGDASHLFAGGIVGFVPSSSQINITNSTFTGSVTIDQTGTTGITFKNAYVGGIVGCVETYVTDFSQTTSYAGTTAGSASVISGCTVTDTALNNTNDGSYDAPWLDVSGSEIYTGGIAGRCTGLITDCTVRNVVISAISEGDGTGRQARPIVGNDWYENSDNARNTYTAVTINGNAAASGTYNGANVAGSVDNRYQTN